jgi:hypothetical protein
LTAAVVGWACVPSPVINTPFLPWRFQAVGQADQGCVDDLQTGLTWANPVYAAGSTPTYSMVGDGRAQDVQAYISQTNVQGWCGAKDWRLPNASELSALQASIVHAPIPVLAIDCSPPVNTGQSWTPAAGGASQPIMRQPSTYWSSTLYGTGYHQSVTFCGVTNDWRSANYHLLSARLVRP